MTTVAQLRVQHLADSLTRLAEHLRPLRADLTVEMLRNLEVESVFTDYVEAYERAPFEADTAEFKVPDGAWDGEDTEPIGVHNRARHT